MIGVSPPGSKATIVWIYLAGEIHGHSGAQMPSPWVNTLARKKISGYLGCQQIVTLRSAPTKMLFSGTLWMELFFLGILQCNNLCIIQIDIQPSWTLRGNPSMTKSKSSADIVQNPKTKNGYESNLIHPACPMIWYFQPASVPSTKVTPIFQLNWFPKIISFWCEKLSHQFPIFLPEMSSITIKIQVGSIQILLYIYTSSIYHHYITSASSLWKSWHPLANHHVPSFPPQKKTFWVPPLFFQGPPGCPIPIPAIQSGADLVAKLSRKAAPRRGALRALEALLQVLLDLLVLMGLKIMVTDPLKNDIEQCQWNQIIMFYDGFIGHMGLIMV